MQPSGGLLLADRFFAAIHERGQSKLMIGSKGVPGFWWGFCEKMGSFFTALISEKNIDIMTGILAKRAEIMKDDFRVGLRRGGPVAVGYFSVSFGFGAVAAVQGIKALDAALISLTNLTSAGQFAGLTLILASAGLWELILTQLVINSRYALMSMALSQRLGPQVGLLPRLAIAFFNTDEIFALAMAEKQPLTTDFFLGLGLLPLLGWTGGTLCGALASSVLPVSVQTALGVMLYGMFIAIVVPPAKQDRSVLVAVAISLVCSCLFAWVPQLKQVSAGVSIVVCTVTAAAVCAWLFPVGEEEMV